MNKRGGGRLCDDDDGIDKQLANIYYAAGDPGSYGGVERLFKRAKDIGIGGAMR